MSIHDDDDDGGGGGDDDDDGENLSKYLFNFITKPFRKKKLVALC